MPNAAMATLAQTTTPAAVPLVQRQNGGGGGGAAAPCTIASTMFSVSNATPQSSGVMTMSRTATPGKVTFTAPTIGFNADVSLTNSFCSGSGETVEVGPVQTVRSSRRVGIYREGGRATGDLVAQHVATMQNRRDAQWTDSSGTVQATVPAPWYSQPQTLSASLRPSAIVSFLDQPVLALPRRIGRGELVETEGSDEFTLALTAKKGAQLVHLASTNWTVPWAMDLLATPRRGQAIGISTAPTGPGVTSGPIAMVSGQEWISFDSEDDAFSADNRTLLDNVKPTFDNDITSYRYIVDALKRKNLIADVVLSVVETASWWGDDIKWSATGRSTVDLGTHDLDEGESTSVALAINSVFPNGLFPDTSILFLAHDEGHRFGELDWAFPFYPQRTPAHFSGEEGSYTLTGVIRS